MTSRREFLCLAAAAAAGHLIRRRPGRGSRQPTVVWGAPAPASVPTWGVTPQTLFVSRTTYEVLVLNGMPSLDGITVFDPASIA